MQKAAIAKIRKSQHKAAAEVSRKNAGITGNEATKLAQVHKDLKEASNNIDADTKKKLHKQNKFLKDRKKKNQRQLSQQEKDLQEKIEKQELQQNTGLKTLEPFEEEKRIRDRKCYWSVKDSGTFVFWYKMWILAHCTFILVFCVARVAFEEKPDIYVVYIEAYFDVVFLIDMIRIFTSPIYNENGKTIWSRSVIFKNYFFGWFLFDVYAFFPLAYFRYVSKHSEGGKDNLQNLMDLNFERLPRFYKMMLVPQLARARFAKQNLVLLFSKMQLPIGHQNVAITFFTLTFNLHVTGCFWYAASFGNILSSYTTWVTENNLQDSGLLYKYVASIYWATVTSTTVGYGDILPTNGYELIWAMCIIVFGVANFSYILSTLASQFGEISRSKANNQERINQIDQLDQKFKIGVVLVDQITEYFTNFDADTRNESNQEMSYLLKVLPNTLKVQLAKFLYADAIYIHRFLQDRDDNFYAKYLEELASEKYNKGDYLIKKGNKPENVIFIMSGVVQNLGTKRYFESGQIINHDCVILRTDTQDDFICEEDVSVLMYTVQTFVQILDQFPDIDEDTQLAIQEKSAHKKNNKFVTNAIRNDQVRKAIVENYNDIIEEEEVVNKRYNKSLALKLNQVSLINNVTKNPNVKFKSYAEKQKEKKARESQPTKSESELSSNEGDTKSREFELNQSINSDEETPMQTPNKRLIHMDSLVGKNVTKVRDMLEKTNKQALNINNRDLDKQFKMPLDTKNTDRTALEYYKKIQKQREFQKKMLPLYLESQRVVAMHKGVIKTIISENDKHIPQQLHRIMDKGLVGLDQYGKLLANIQSTLEKNQSLTSSLNEYQINVKTVMKRAKQTDDLVSVLNGEGGETKATMQRIEKSKGRIQDLLKGMFKNVKEDGIV